MPHPQEPTNALLSALPAKERALLFLHLRPISLPFEQILYEPDELIRFAYFPTSGVVSLLVVLSDGSTAEVGRIGNEGMPGLPIFLGVRTSYTRAIVQVAGQALRMNANVFRREAQRNARLSSGVAMDRDVSST